MKKLVLVLMAGGLLFTSCGSDTDETTEAATEAANGIIKLTRRNPKVLIRLSDPLAIQRPTRF